MSWHPIALIAGLLLASCEHDGGWFWLVNTSGVCLVALVAATQTEEA